MGQVVDNGRCVGLGRPIQGARRHRGGHDVAKLYAGKGRQVRIKSNRKERVLRIESDLGVVQVHFGGVSRSEALRLSLALTATAIRAGRLSVG